MSWSPFAHLISPAAYWLVGVAIGLESMGVPAPGEATLVTAAVVAGTTHRLSLPWIMISAAIGAIVGDNIGYLIGRRFGARVLERYGRVIRMSPDRISVAQYIFAKYGGAIVFVGRFVPVLRTLAALLAGTNRMHWPRFVLFNAAGAIVWVVTYGSAAYAFGQRIERVRGPIGVGVLAVAAIGSLSALWWMHRHEDQLLARVRDATHQ
jgi:membrane protein DedA with SNARE-associated domain